MKILYVWKNKITDVIYIKDFYVGDTEYKRNTLRRCNDFKPYLWGKTVCDFEFGKAQLLSKINNIVEIGLPKESQVHIKVNCLN